jgi:hypothetical protein
MKGKLKENYGPYFDRLSAPEQRAVEKYIWAMAKPMKSMLGTRKSF